MYEAMLYLGTVDLSIALRYAALGFAVACCCLVLEIAVSVYRQHHHA